MRYIYFLISIFMYCHFANAEEILSAMMYNKSGIIEVKPASGWKIYYKNPGSFGEPMKVLQNNQEIKFKASPPERISSKSFEEFVYRNKFYLEPELSQNSEAPLIIEYTACNNICVTGKIEVANIDTFISGADLPSFSNSTLNIPVNKLRLDTDYNDIIFHDRDLITRVENGAIYLIIQPKTPSPVEALVKKGDIYKIAMVNLETIPYNSKGTTTYVPTLSLITMAFFGGLLLNIMPCVLPVLFLKIWGIVKYNNISRRHIFATILGIFSFFLTIGTLSIAISSIGGELGWGIQFQNKYYVLFLVLITLIFGVVMLGLVKLPPIYFDIKNRFEYLEHYLSGILACLLATPCTAPFLGSVLGFTLSMDHLNNALVYFFIFVGFATPYFIMLVKPKLLLFVQNLSIYSIIINKILGISLIITSVWLGTIFLYQIDIFKNQQNEWIEFSEAKLEEELKKGNLVFVDITAKWCLTCQFNKVRVLDTKEIQKVFSTYNVTLLRGNYTVQNTEIENYLHKNQRKGIPFNAIYDKKGNIHIFSEFLDIKSVKRKVKELAKQ